MLRHHETGETNTFLQYHWLVDRTTICKIVHQVCQAILAEFQEEYSICPTDFENWKKVEEKFRTKWNVPHALGALDGKHIAMKKPKKSGSDYYNYKSFFSLVLLALIETEHRFLWIDCGSSESSSDEHIFNRGDLNEKIEDGSLGLLAPELLGEGGPDLHYILLGFALMPWMVKQYGRRQLTRVQRIANYMMENVIGIRVIRFRVLLGTMEQRPKIVRDTIFTCVVCTIC